MTEPKSEGRANGPTVRIRVVVVASPDGYWNCEGWYMPERLTDEDLLAEAVANMHVDAAGQPLSVTYIEADVPLPVVTLPETRTIEADATSAEQLEMD